MVDIKDNENENKSPVQQIQNVQESFISNNKNMEQAYKLSSKFFKKQAEQVLSEEERKLLLKKAEESDILVIRGSYDHAETVFQALEIPHVVISSSQLDEIDLSPEKILFINCPGSDLSRKHLDKILHFVEEGGMLITTDWALKYVLEPLFPGLVRHNGVKTADDVVRVEFNLEEDPFIAKFIDEQDEPLWWLEGASYPIQVLDPKRVKILAYSDEMARKYGEGPIIITFEHKSGIVFHMTSHLYLQRSETRSARQKQEAIAFAKTKNIALDDLTEQEKEQLSKLKVGEVESAFTSQVAINRMIFEQRKRVEERKKKGKGKMNKK
ncbi:MAG: hypothetical protein ACP6IU_15130 [Candidatus Asgardarchaeia archaeon]